MTRVGVLVPPPCKGTDASPVETAAKAGSDGSEQPLRPGDSMHPGCDGGSTQLGTGTSQGYSQGKPTGTSLGRPTCDEICTGLMTELPIPIPGDGCTLYLEDLHTFRVCIEKPLHAAYRALENVDKDICQAIGRMLQQVVELSDSTATVVKTDGVLAHRIRYDVLPHFKFAISQADTNAQTSHLAVAQMVISKMKNDAKVVRGAYLSLLECVQYLITCTQMALDFFEISEAPVDPHEMATVRQALTYALRELKHVHNVLADPSDFWLIFHVTELELGRIEDFIQQKMPRVPCTTMCSHVCDALEQLSLQYLMPRKNDGSPGCQLGPAPRS